MKVSTEGIFAELLAELPKEKARLQAEALQFPGSPELYRGLPQPKRLEVARKMLARYADNSGHYDVRGGPPDEQRCATATLQTDDPGIIIEARVGYDNGKRNTDTRKHPVIKVWASVRDSEDDVATTFRHLGEIGFEPYKLHDGTRFGEWETEPHAVVGYNTVLPLSDKTTQSLIGIIDEAVCNLITGVVAKNQSVGGVAVGGATS